MLRFTASTLLVFLILLGCRPADQSDAAASKLALEPCTRPEDSPALAIVAESRCGLLPVAEDPALPDGRTIDLNIMVIPAVNPSPRPDPIFYLAGGPGQAATEVGPLLFAAMRALRKERDIVLVDQRGTGSSSPLNCDFESPSMDDQELSLQRLGELELQAVKECLEDLEAGTGWPDPGGPDPGGPDPRFYTTPIAMDDLDAVRAALGYTEINVIGGSYGTRAALVYLRRHGDHVRSVVLDAVVPLTMRIPASMATDASRALDLLLDNCQSDTGCDRDFPDLRAHLTELIDRLRDAPELMHLNDPRTGEKVTARAFAANIMMLIRAALYSSELSSLLPLAIDAAYGGDFQPLVTMGSFFSSESMGMSVGMFLSVLCSEDLGAGVPYEYPARNVDPLFEGTFPTDLAPVCAIWPRGTLSSDYFTPVVSDKPVLLLSGVLDPITPPHWGEEALRTLSHGKHIVVPGAGHGTMTLPCVRRAVEAFLDDPSSDSQLDTRCVASIRRPTFFYSKAGPVEQAP